MYMKLALLLAFAYSANAGGASGNVQLNGPNAGVPTGNPANLQVNPNSGSGYAVTRGLGLLSGGYGGYGGYGYGPINYGIPQYGYGPVNYGGYGYLRGYGSAADDSYDVEPEVYTRGGKGVSNVGGMNFGKNTAAGTINSNINNQNGVNGAPLSPSSPSYAPPPPAPAPAPTPDYGKTRGLYGYGLPSYGLPLYGYGPIRPNYGLPYIRGYGAPAADTSYDAAPVEEYTRSGRNPKVTNTGGVNFGDNTTADKINSNINNTNKGSAVAALADAYAQTRGLGVLGGYGGLGYGGYGYGPVNYGLPQYGYAPLRPVGYGLY